MASEIRINPEMSNSTIITELGSRLKARRLARNIDQELFSFESGIPVRTLSRLENGHTASLETVIKVLRSLDLLERLDLLVPAPELSPVARAKHKTATARKRASKPKKSIAQEPPAQWNGFSAQVKFDSKSNNEGL